MPKANSATGTVTLTTYSGSTAIGTSSVSFTAKVTNSNPTFSNFTYEDVGSVSTQLTGNNQILINNFNGLKVTISTSNKAVAKNSATMSKYRLVCGNKSVEANYSSSSNVTLSLDYVTSMTFIVYAIDSRGNSTSVTKSASIWKDYANPTISSASAVRTNGVNTETTLAFSGTFWNDSFGAVTNEIVTCTYKYKKTSESNYGAEIDITPTISGNNFSFSSLITGDEGANGFSLSNSYNIQITIVDKIRTITYNVLLGAGSPAMAIHNKGVAFGTPYDDSIGGIVQFLANKYLATGGAINLNNSDITRANCIWMNDEADSEGIMFLKQGATVGSTNSSDYECLRGYRGNLYYNDKKIIDDSGWASLTFSGNWTNYGTTDYFAGQYRKINNHVFVRGLVKNSSNTSTTIARLPSGYRPSKNVYCTVVINDNPKGCYISPNGYIVLATSYTSGNWVDLNGISFFVD